jgi:hypothetical protein
VTSPERQDREEGTATPACLGGVVSVDPKKNSHEAQRTDTESEHVGKRAGRIVYHMELAGLEEDKP